MSTSLNEYLQQIETLWNQAFKPHCLAWQHEAFIKNLETVKKALETHDYQAAETIADEIYQENLAASYHANISGPALAYFDMFKLAKEFRDAIREAGN